MIDARNPKGAHLLGLCITLLLATGSCGDGEDWRSSNTRPAKHRAYGGSIQTQAGAAGFAGTSGSAGMSEVAGTTGAAGCLLTHVGERVVEGFDATKGRFGFKSYTPDDPAYANLSSRSTLSWVSTEGDPLPGALKVTAPFTDHKQFVELELSLTARDLTNQIVFVRVKVMPGFESNVKSPPHVVFFVKTGSNYVFTSTWASITQYGEWVEYVLDPATASTHGTVAADFTQVVAAGLQIRTSESSDSSDMANLPRQATFYVDTIGFRPNNSDTALEVCVPIDDRSEDQVVVEPVENAKPVVGERWRGFNLVGMFALQWPDTNRGFKEMDFAAIADLGFNYARLPLDYRTYTKQTDWLSYDVTTIGGLDQAIAWAQKYGVHADLNLHRAPGYCVQDYDGRIVDLPASQNVYLWKDKVAQDAFVEHWRMLAKRYQKIAPEHLSFNLVNEPHQVDQTTYVSIMTRAIQAIREVSPDRTIVVDGINTANDPIEDPVFIQIPNVIQSKHAYDFQKFQWYDTPYNPGSDSWPKPHWPPTLMAKYLFGPLASGAVTTPKPLIIDGEFPAGTKVTIHVGDVYSGARLDISTEREKSLVDAVLFRTQDDASWVASGSSGGSQVYSKHYDADFSGTLNQAATQLVFEVTEQNYLSFDQITLEIEDKKLAWIPTLGLGVPHARFKLTGDILTPVSYPAGTEKYYDLGYFLVKWKAIAQKGVRVMIGEFNQTNKTDYADAYRFYEFLLGNFKDADFGWAHWDFDSTNPQYGGAFINNQRTGGQYEEYNGYQLDRNMLQLFQAY